MRLKGIGCKMDADHIFMSCVRFAIADNTPSLLYIVG